MESIETIELETGHRIEVWHDDHAESPRHDDNLGTFWTWHRRYSSPDSHSIPDPMYSLPPNHIGIKVWMYDHSGHCYAAADQNPFHCPFDSGQVGWIFASRETIRTYFGVKRVTRKIRQQARDTLEWEVKIYNEWASGEVYGFTVYDANNEELDTCGGFYGSDRDYMIEQAKECLK